MIHKILIGIRHLSCGMLFLIVATSCETDLPRSKTAYLQQFEQFTRVFKERLPELTETEFQHFNEQYRLLSQDYYDLFDEKLTVEEKKQVWQCRLRFLSAYTKYQIQRNGEQIFKQFEQYILGPPRVRTSSQSI